LLPMAQPPHKARNHDTGIQLDSTSGTARRQAESANQAHDPKPSGTAPKPNYVNRVTP